MWKYFEKNLNNGIEINMKESFYCGDAAGRPKSGSRKKDFSDGDRKFALNIGIDFKSPEMLFLGLKETLPKIEFDPKKLAEGPKSIIKGGKAGDDKDLASDK